MLVIRDLQLETLTQDLLLRFCRSLAPFVEAHLPKECASIAKEELAAWIENAAAMVARAKIRDTRDIRDAVLALMSVWFALGRGNEPESLRRIMTHALPPEVRVAMLQTEAKRAILKARRKEQQSR